MPGNVCYVPIDIGEIVYITVANPAAGADFNYAIPAGVIFQPLTIHFLLTCSAAAANRYNRVMFNDAGGVALNCCQQDLACAAGNTIWFNYGLNGPNINPAAHGIKNQAIPFIYLIPGHNITTNTLAIQAGDQYSEIRITARRWRI